MRYFRNGELLPVHLPFSVGEGDDSVQYPPYWLEKSTEADREALGIATEPAPPAAAPTKDQLKAAAAFKRWQLETGGITLNGALIRTDMDARTNILGAREEAIANPAYTLNWKDGNGVWVTLDATAIVGISNAMRAHIQGCFDAEKAVHAKIDNDTYTTMEAVNGAVEWPA